MKTTALLIVLLSINFGYSQTTKNFDGTNNKLANPILPVNSIKSSTTIEPKITNTENVIVIKEEENDFSSIIELLNAIELTDKKGNALVAVSNNK